jgi:flagellin
MAFQINTNIAALNAYNALAKTSAQTAKAQLRLATMKRINSVADDTSGFKVGKELEGSNLIMKAQLNNVSSGQNWLSTAESALTLVNDKLIQIAAKQQDANDPLKSRDSLTADVKAIAEEIDSILHSTGINGNNVFADAIASFGVGGSTGSLGVNIGGKLALTATHQATIDALKAGDASTLGTAIGAFASAVGDALGYVGNNMQVLESKQEYLTSAIANNTATISRLFDADMAMEQLNATKGQIGTQIGTAMLGTLNAAPQSLLSLFR